MKAVGECERGWPSVQRNEHPAHDGADARNGQCQRCRDVEMELTAHDFGKHTLRSRRCPLATLNQQPLQPLSPSNFLASLFLN